jgi:hypothetical protein
MLGAACVRNIYTFASIFLLGFLRDANRTTFLTTKVNLALNNCHHMYKFKKMQDSRSHNPG